MHMNERNIKNYLYNLSYQILMVISPLITAPYISRVLHADGVGVYSYTFTLATAFSLFAALGVNTYGQREIAYCQDDVIKRSKTFWEIFIGRLITTAIVGVTYLVFCFAYKEYTFYLLLQAFIVFANMIDISWLYQGLENFKVIAVRNIFIKIFTVVMIFWMVKEPTHVGRYILINSLSAFASYTFFFVGLKKEIVKIPVSELDWRKHIKGSLEFFIPLIATQLYSQLDKIMLGAITRDTFENGYYEQARKIVNILVMILTSVNSVMYPRISYLFANGEKSEIKKSYKISLRTVCLILMPMILGVCITADNFVVWFFGSEYVPVANLMKWSSLLLVFMAMGNFVGMQYLSPMGMQNKMTKAYLIAAAVNFCLNLLLIPCLYSVGALIASIAAEAVSCFMQLHYFEKSEYAIPLWKTMWKYVVAALVMGVILLGFNAILPVVGVLQTIADIALGGVVYIVCLVLLKEELVGVVWKAVKAKM